MKNNKLVFIFLAIVMAIIVFCVGCAAKDGNITLQYIYYQTQNGYMFFEEESLGIEYFEINGNRFRSTPYTIYNLPGNKEYHYEIKAYDAEGTLMASGSGNWMVVEGVTNPQTTTLTVMHQHSYSDDWSSDDNYHWHASSCGHSSVSEKANHTFDGDICIVCGFDNDKHVHTFSSSWSSNDSYHWHEATCGYHETSDRAQHSFGSGTVTKEPTCTKTGTGTHTCTVCGKTVTYSIPKIQHTLSVDGVCSVCGLHEATGCYVFYDKGEYSDGWRYLEAAPADLRVVDGVPTVDSTVSGYSTASTGYLFGYYRTSDSGSNLFVSGTTTYNAAECTGTAIGTGKTNTQLLVGAMGNEAYSSKSGSAKTANYAAKLCDILTYTANGVTYDDWFLPSKDELNLMYVNLRKNGLGGFADNPYYWSSSESSYYTYYAWAQSFYYGDQSYGNRYDKYGRVRPVRAF